LISATDLATGLSNACGFCNPRGNEGDPNAFILPLWSDHPLSDSDRAYANKKAAPGQCECGSRIHIIETNGTWRCPDCNAQIRSPKAINTKTEYEVEAAVD
jgi:predicted RNA-binding Zn-ribbon protein involved in translation (DUF1610 family)